MLVCSGLQLAWIIVFVILYGWDCGIQHLMFEMLVLVYFAVYNSLVYKISYTVVLFAVRFSLFLYCRVNISVFALTETATVVLQIINTIVTFVLMAVACSMFSSNVESAEKKLVLYNEQLKKQAGTDPLTGLWNRRQMMRILRRSTGKSLLWRLPLVWAILISLRGSMTTGDMTAEMRYWYGSHSI